jgi:hypothetical protein
MVASDQWKHILDALKRIEGLSAIPEGWNFGKGKRPLPVTAAQARTILLMLANSGAVDFEIFPEDEGGILIAGYGTTDRFEILTRADGVFELAYQDEDVLLMAEIGQLRAELEKRGWQSQRSLGSYTRHISAESSSDMYLLPFVIQKAAFPLSTLPASMRRGFHYALTSAPTIQAESVAHRHDFGGLRPRNLLQLVG